MSRLPRNDPRQYDALAGEWWAPRGAFVMLRWIAAARARLVPAPVRPGAVLLDVACGGGLLVPHVATRGYRHVGVDLSPTATRIARDHGLKGVARGDVLALPFRDQCAEVVVAGEILEHVTDLPAAVAECCRVLRPGGRLVIDTIADTPLARFLTITVAERIPGGAPPGLHDPALFVDRDTLGRECARHGVALRIFGLRPAILDLMAWLVRLRRDVRMRPTRWTTVLFQGVGVREET